MKVSEQLTNILIIGGGKGGNALLTLLIRDPTISIVGLVDLNSNAPGVLSARKYGIPVAKHPNQFLDSSDKYPLDVIVNVTGDENIYHSLREALPDKVIISGKAAKFVWDFLEVAKSNTILKDKFITLKESLTESQNNEIIYGTNPRMQQIREMIHQVAPTLTTVFIVGETGSGKKIIAEEIQKLSGVADRVFVRINCTSFSSEILESELFGYVQGAFPGANKSKKGLLEKGNGGTIFFDEIGDLSMDMQARILRFLQFGEVKPMGSTKIKIVKARIIMATNKKLEEQIKENKFRGDLYYRLNAFVIINLPPLRQRKEDIPVLAYLFLKKLTVTLNKKIVSISSSAMNSLNEYDYPGNIRELQSIIERAIILCDGTTITPAQLAIKSKYQHPIEKYDLGLIDAKRGIIEQFERQAIQYYLLKSKGKITDAAKMAKIPRRSFYRLLEKYKIAKDPI